MTDLVAAAKENVLRLEAKRADVAILHSNGPEVPQRVGRPRSLNAPGRHVAPPKEEREQNARLSHRQQAEGTSTREQIGKAARERNAMRNTGCEKALLGASRSRLCLARRVLLRTMIADHGRARL